MLQYQQINDLIALPLRAQKARMVFNFKRAVIMTHLFSRQKRLEKFTQIFTSDEDALLWAATRHNSLAAFEAFKKELGFFRAKVSRRKDYTFYLAYSPDIDRFYFTAQFTRQLTPRSKTNRNAAQIYTVQHMLESVNLAYPWYLFFAERLVLEIKSIEHLFQPK